MGQGITVAMLPNAAQHSCNAIRHLSHSQNGSWNPWWDMDKSTQWPQHLQKTLQPDKQHEKGTQLTIVFSKPKAQ